MDRRLERAGRSTPPFVAFYQPVPAVAPLLRHNSAAGLGRRLQAALAGPPAGPSHCAIQAIGGNSNTLFLVTAVKLRGRIWHACSAQTMLPLVRFAQFMLAGFRVAALSLTFRPSTYIR